MQFNYIDNYLKWLRDNTFEKKVNNNISRLTFPFLDNNNTMTELYIINNNDKFKITDDGYTFSELEFVNFDFSSPRRKKIIENILNNHGVSIDDNNALFVEATKETLAFKKHLLIQCMLKINDLTHLSKSNIKTLFNEDVETFMFENDVRFMKDIALVGKSKLQSNYDFAIGKSKSAPERVIKLINSIDSTQIKSVIFSWEDVKECRDPNSKLITIINDLNKKVSNDNINAFKEYNIDTILWSQKQDNLYKLTA